MTDPAGADDPPPLPPPQPDLDACCGSGCDPCIFDVYEQAMERFRAEWSAWNARRAPGATRAEQASRPAERDAALRSFADD